MRFLLLTLLAVAGACAPAIHANEVLLPGAAQRAPVPAASVQVFLPGDELPAHERVAIIDVREGFKWWGKANPDRDRNEMIEALRERAGELGANAIILDSGQDSEELGIDGAPHRIERAVAIYVIPAP